ncbi:uracil-DNA glycosylase, partial [Acinetobacter baumannii]
MQLTEQQQNKLSKVQLEESWKRSLAPFLLSPQMDSLRDFLFQQKQAQK